MRSYICFACISLALLSGCGQQGFVAKSETEKVATEVSGPSTPQSVNIALDKRVLSDKTIEREGRKTRRHEVQFGNWISACVGVRETAKPVRGWCDVYPATAGPVTAKNPILPSSNRATVQFFERKPAKIVLRTSARQPGTELSYSCGTKHWSGPENMSRLKFFYDREAMPFLMQMQRSDCTLSFVPRGQEATATLTFPSHGFKQAFDYARYYSPSPKGV